MKFFFICYILAIAITTGFAATPEHNAYPPPQSKGIPGNDVPGHGSFFAPQPEFKIPSSALKDAKFSAALEVLEESGQTRLADIRCGIPVAQGQLTRVDNLTVTDRNSKSLNAQFAAIGFWPEGSIKWLLVDFTCRLNAGQRTTFQVINFAAEQAPQSALKWQVDSDVFVIHTGAMTVEIGRWGFQMPRKILLAEKNLGGFSSEGVEILDPQQNQVPWQGGRIRVEESGTHHLTLLAEGWGSGGSVNVRMTFTADSPILKLQIRYINTDFQSEFLELSSMCLRWLGMETISKMTADGATVQRIMQHHDRKLERDGNLSSLRMSGAGRLEYVDKALTFALLDAALRYPKAFSHTAKDFKIELLPKLPNADFATDLPYYLRAPYSNGNYRLKWGMGFTEEVLIDFSAMTPPETLAAPEVLAVVDRDYLYSTGVIPGVRPSHESAFDDLNTAMSASLDHYLKARENQREYGFANYGDWFGERGFNWGNNEYDLAHGLYGLYFRSGNRRAARLARLAARHQADVDIINAYPAPEFIGGNPQHAIAHNGHRYDSPRQVGGWSGLYDSRQTGINGHTWSRGMLDAWCVHGDANVMTAALKSGEHLSRYLTPTPMGLNERANGWAMNALLAFYDVLGNQRYLHAAESFKNVALQAQNFQRGGAWPHLLPPGHDGRFENTMGNCLFYVAVLGNALRQYYRCTADNALQRSLLGVGGWLKLCFDPGSAGWPYTASWEGRPYFRISSDCNLLIAPVYAIAGRFSGDRSVRDGLRRVAALTLTDTPTGNGKLLAMKLLFLGDFIDDLATWDTEPLTESEAFRILATGDNNFAVRGPIDKKFAIHCSHPAGNFRLTRVPYGAKQKNEPEYVVKISKEEGEFIQEFRASTDAYSKHDFILEDTGKFIVDIHDDHRGYWELKENSEQRTADIYSFVAPEYSLASGPVFNRYLLVPEGTRNFQLKFFCSAGPNRVLIYRPDASIAADRSFDKGVLLLDIPVEAKHAGTWSVLMVSASERRDVGLQIQGIPPWIKATK
ncbi:MAG: hypothetical protein WCT05_12210 [Lentisphaeria bacterium]